MPNRERSVEWTITSVYQLNSKRRTATVTRKTKDGSVFYGDQKMTRAEALKSYTWNGAHAAKEETLKGSIAVGKLTASAPGTSSGQR